MECLIIPLLNALNAVYKKYISKFFFHIFNFNFAIANFQGVCFFFLLILSLNLFSFFSFVIWVLNFILSTIFSCNDHENYSREKEKKRQEKKIIWKWQIKPIKRSCLPIEFDFASLFFCLCSSSIPFVCKFALCMRVWCLLHIEFCALICRTYYSCQSERSSLFLHFVFLLFFTSQSEFFVSVFIDVHTLYISFGRRHIALKIHRYENYIWQRWNYYIGFCTHTQMIYVMWNFSGVCHHHTRGVSDTVLHTHTQRERCVDVDLLIA